MEKTDTSEYSWCDSGEPPPLHQVSSVEPPDQEVMERYMEACGWKHPRAPSVRLLWDERATEVALDFLQDTRVGCMGAPRGGGEDSENEGGGLNPPYNVLFFCSFPLFVSFAFSFSFLLFGRH